MTEEQLQQGNILKNRIENLERTIDFNSVLLNERVIRQYMDCSEIPLSERINLEKKYADEARAQLRAVWLKLKEEYAAL